jgi:hypothetical protein
MNNEENKINRLIVKMEERKKADRNLRLSSPGEPIAELLDAIA